MKTVTIRISRKSYDDLAKVAKKEQRTIKATMEIAIAKEVLESDVEGETT